MSNKILAVVGLTFMFALLLLPVAPGAYALTDAQQTQIIASSTEAIDTAITTNFNTVWKTVIGYTLLFGFVAVVGALAWKGIRALMGRA